MTVDGPDAGARPPYEDVAAEVDALMPWARARLEDLVRIPSVSSRPDPATMASCAEAVAEVLGEAGLSEVVVESPAEGAPPLVRGALREGGRPTVLLYAHYDVQPADDRSWTGSPFDPQEREGRLFGRGTADDKAGVLAHAVAIQSCLRARGSLPVDVVVVIEGEEEVGSRGLRTLLENPPDWLAGDLAIVADAVNPSADVPGLAYLLRGSFDVTVTVRTADGPLHSGVFGGSVPDAVTALARLLSRLHDEAGRVAVPALWGGVRGPTAEERTALAAADPHGRRREAALRPGVALLGESRELATWFGPAVAVVGMDVPSLPDFAHVLVPAASARLNVRLAPEQDVGAVSAAFEEWLLEAAPWGAEVEVVHHAGSPGHRGDPTSPALQAAADALGSAFGSRPTLGGLGGTIPFVAPLSRALGGAEVVLTGVADMASAVHGIDESLSLAGWRRACQAEAQLLGRLGAADRREEMQP